MGFRPATREKLKLRMAIDGPAKSGKSLTALRFAHGLGKRIAVIDTEFKSASKYAGLDYGEGPLKFDVEELASFHPMEYMRLIEEAANARYDVIVIDSLSHAWQGKDGVLEIADKNGKGSGWMVASPLHRRLIDSVLACPCHVIATMRSKMEYVFEQNDKGKVAPRKIGMAPVQREGVEYEFDIYASMEQSHFMTITGSRCGAVEGAYEFKPGAKFMEPIIAWLESGEAQRPASAFTNGKADESQLRAIMGILAKIGRMPDEDKKELMRRYSVREYADLSRDQADTHLKLLSKEAEKAGVSVASFNALVPPPGNGAAPAQNGAAAPAQPAAKGGSKEGAAGKLGIRLQQKIDSRKNELVARELMDDETWAAVLAKRNVTAVDQLTKDQAETLVKAMIIKLARYEHDAWLASDADDETKALADRALGWVEDWENLDVEEADRFWKAMRHHREIHEMGKKNEEKRPVGAGKR